MTRQHFVAIAAKLKALRPTNRDIQEENLWNEMVIAMAQVGTTFNDYFSASRFIDACGGLFNKEWSIWG